MRKENLELFYMCLIVAGLIILPAILAVAIPYISKRRRIHQAINEAISKTEEIINNRVKDIASSINKIKQTRETTQDPLKGIVLDAYLVNYFNIIMHDLYTRLLPTFDAFIYRNEQKFLRYISEIENRIKEHSGIVKYDLSSFIPDEILTSYTNVYSPYSIWSRCPYIKTYRNNFKRLTFRDFYGLGIWDNGVPTFVDIHDNTIYLFPTFIVIDQEEGNIIIQDIYDLETKEKLYVSVSTDPYTEYDQPHLVYGDVTVYGYEWEYMTKTGERDLRYSQNKRFPNFQRVSFFLSVEDIAVLNYTTNYNASISLQNALTNLVKCVGGYMERRLMELFNYHQRVCPGMSVKDFLDKYGYKTLPPIDTSNHDTFSANESAESIEESLNQELHDSVP